MLDKIILNNINAYQLILILNDECGNMAKMTTISLRVDEDFRALVEQVADSNERDISSEVKFRLKQSLMQDGILKKEDNGLKVAMV